MTTTAAQGTLEKVVDAFNRHDAAALAASYTEDAVVYDPYYPEPLRGRQAIEKDIADFFRAFPDLTNRVVRVMVQDDVVAAQFEIEGTHKGPLALPDREIPATNRKLSFSGAGFSRVNEQGLVVEEHRYYDVAGQLAQLGLA